MFPDGKKPVNSPVDFAVLRQISMEYGHQLAVVINDEDWRFDAAGAGLITFDSLRQAQKSTWKRDKLPFKKKGVQDRKLIDPESVLA
ncbi:MAG: hypothetical protein LWX83_04640 [Anaerolineae bacterium]|nr:hypothetical protein [Anaerolineae bacterium]